MHTHSNFTIREGGFSWNNNFFDAKLVAAAVENSKWGPILNGETDLGWKCVRFKAYKPDNMPLQTWAKLIGENGVVLTHVRRTAELSRDLICGPSDALYVARLIYLVEQIHDLGEAASEHGDIMTGQKSRIQYGAELSALKIVLCDIFGLELTEQLYAHVRPVLDGSMHHAANLRKALTMFDHLLTGLEMYEKAREQPEPIKSHLQWLTYDVLRNTLPFVLSRCDLIPKIKELLRQRGDTFAEIFSMLPFHPAIQRLYQQRLVGKTMRTYEEAVEGFTRAEQAWFHKMVRPAVASRSRVLSTSVRPELGAAATQ